MINLLCNNHKLKQSQKNTASSVINYSNFKGSTDIYKITTSRNITDSIDILRCGDVAQLKFILIDNNDKIDYEKYTFWFTVMFSTILLTCRKEKDYYVIEFKDSYLLNILLCSYYKTTIHCDNDISNAKIYVVHYYFDNYIRNKKLINCPIFIEQNHILASSNIKKVSEIQLITIIKSDPLLENQIIFILKSDEDDVQYIKIKFKKISDKLKVKNGFITFNGNMIVQAHDFNIMQIIQKEFFNLCSVESHELVFPLNYVNDKLLPMSLGTDMNKVSVELTLELEEGIEDPDLFIGFI